MSASFFSKWLPTWGPNQVKLHVEGLHCRICRSQQRSSNHQRSTRKNPPQKWLERCSLWNHWSQTANRGVSAVSPPLNSTENCPTTPVSALQSPCCRLSAWHRAPWLGRWMSHRKLTLVIPFFGGVWPSDLTWDLSQRVFKIPWV